MLAQASVLRAPTMFFDMTPVGRIIARFSKDMDQARAARAAPRIIARRRRRRRCHRRRCSGSPADGRREQIDNVLSGNLAWTLFTTTSVITALVVISGVTPWFAILIPFLLMLYVHCEQTRCDRLRTPLLQARRRRAERAADVRRLRCAQL
jgi:hypothetical protein